MAVNTMVIEVPMLNAAPPLRIRVMVRKPPSRRIGGWLGIRATTMALEMTSAAMTNAATPSRRATRRGRLGGPAAESGSAAADAEAESEAESESTAEGS